MKASIIFGNRDLSEDKNSKTMRSLLIEELIRQYESMGIRQKLKKNSIIWILDEGD